MRGKRRRTIRVSSARPQHAIYPSIGGYRVVLDILFRSSSQDLVAASGQRRPAKPSGALCIMQSTTTCYHDMLHIIALNYWQVFVKYYNFVFAKIHMGVPLH